MDDVRTIYNRLWDQFSKEMPRGNHNVDKWIDDQQDDRYGITLITRPHDLIKQEVSSFLEELAGIEPGQYYYPPHDMHVTVMSIISCFTGFRLQQIDKNDYREIISHCLASVGPFEIRFEGITASPSAILVQGFPTNSSLALLRDNLREAFKTQNLVSSIDSRYSIKTAHMTVVRFRQPVLNIEQYMQVLSSYRSHVFGVIKVNELELVFNDWYQRRDVTRLLAAFKL